MKAITIRKYICLAIYTLFLITIFHYSGNSIPFSINNLNLENDNEDIISINRINSAGDPEIKDVRATPSSTLQGGYVNISCNVTDDIVIDEVWVNITYPDNSFHNESMVGGQLKVEDFTTFEELDPNNHIDVTSTKVTQQSWHNEDSYLVKNYTNGYFDDFIHYLEVNMTYSSNNRARTFWQVCNVKAPYVDLFFSTERYISLYSWQLPGRPILQMTEHLSNAAFYDSHHNISWNTNYYLTIIKNGTNISVEIYTNSGRTDLNGTLHLNLHENHKFRYLYAANSWNQSVSEHADGWCANLSLIPEEYYYNSTYSMCGTYSYFIWANDTSGNSNRTTSSTFTIGETIAPTITNVVDYPDPQEAGGYVNITCDVNDNVAVDEVWVNITYPDSSYHNKTMLGGSYYFNDTYSMVGSYSYFIWANDTSGNSNRSTGYSFVIEDTTPPEISDVADAPDPQEAGGYVNITCNVIDNVAVDEVWVNITDPGNNSINVSMSGGSYYFNDTYSMLGTYSYFIWANDTYHNSNISQIYNFSIVDTLSPEIRNVDANPDPQIPGGYVNISCNVTDNVAVDEVWVNITYPDSSYHNKTMLGGSYYFNDTYFLRGVYSFFIWANDTNKNSNISTTYSFEIINQPPYVPSNPYPVNGSFNIDVNVTLSWTGGDPDGDNVTYTIYFGNTSSPSKIVDNQTNTTYDLYFLEDNTTYYWRIVAWDHYNAFTKSPMWWFSTFDNKHPLKPTIQSYPAYGRPGTLLEFSAISTDPDGDQIYYKWDWGDDSYSDWLGPFESGDAISSEHAWENGNFSIYVKTKDIHGAESNWSDPAGITIEDESPNVKITKPEKALYINNRKIIPRLLRRALIIGSIEITVDTTDDLSGIDKVEFYIDGDFKAEDSKYPFIYVWVRDEISLFGHSHRIIVISYDGAGNTAQDTIRVWKIL
jgi:hypothetical protein